MKKHIKQWALRLTMTSLLLAGLLIIIVLNPILTYAHQTKHQQYTVFHQQPLHAKIKSHLTTANQLIAGSEFYNPKMEIDVCLNDGAFYPKLMKGLRGDAFAWGFYNKIVLQGDADFKKNYVALNGYRWNLVQLLAHEAVHCLQYDKLGFWHSNPVANIPAWKWEGYAEYIARQNETQKNLAANIKRLIRVEQTAHNGWINFSDGTGTVISYYKYWLLVQFCMDIKRITYQQVLESNVAEEAIQIEMLRWYQQQLLKNKKA